VHDLPNIPQLELLHPRPHAIVEALLTDLAEPLLKVILVESGLKLHQLSLKEDLGPQEFLLCFGHLAMVSEQASQLEFELLKRLFQASFEGSLEVLSERNRRFCLLRVERRLGPVVTHFVRLFGLGTGFGGEGLFLEGKGALV